MMKEFGNIVHHINKMMVVGKDLILIGNIIFKPMQMLIILNSLPPSWHMADITLEVIFTNLTLNQLPLRNNKIR